ncbi:MAG: beta-ketoacyl synthase N-terminal-like domain-containing protein [Thermoanaerobaculia bacterium]
MSGPRAVVTGLGLVTPLGSSLESTRSALEEGRSAIASATLFDASPFASPLAGEVKELDARAHFRLPKALKLCDRRTRFAVCAAAMALAHAGFPSGPCEGLGVAIGTSGSDLGAEELSTALVRGEEPRRAALDTAVFGEAALAGLNPLWLLLHLPNMASAHVAIQVEARGPNTTVMTGWAAGLSAIVEGAAWITEGSAVAVLAGGADSAVHPFAFAALEQAGLFSPPLPGTSPLVPAEGAAVVLLEEREAALARGARILAEVGDHALAPGGRLSLLVAGAAPAPAARLERHAGNLLAAHAPAAIVLALAGGLSSPVAAFAEGPAGEATAIQILPPAGAEGSTA